MTSPALFLLLVIVCGAALVWSLVRLLQAGAARAEDRARYLALCHAQFTDLRHELAPTGFARLNGRYQGHLFDLQVIPDTLSVRKLPCLWLMVTLAEPQPTHGTLDIMQRATGLETFSHFPQMSYAHPLGSDFPETTSLRSDNPTAPPTFLLRRHAGFFADPRAKELVISPKGIRLVWLAEEADRSTYLIFRNAEMGACPLDPALLKPLLDRAVALSRSLQANQHAPAA